MTEYHRLGPDHLAALASGLGGSGAIRELNASRLSRHLLLLKFLADRWPADRRHLDPAVAILADAQRRDPAVFADLIGDPLVGAWLTRTARRLRRAAPLTSDALQLGALAAAAAVRLGLDGEVTGYARRGRLVLPTVGEIELADRGDGPVTIAVVKGSAAPAGGSGTSREFRRLTARRDDVTCTVRVDDGDPYRDGYHEDPSERLPDEEIARWQRIFDGAWDLIRRYASPRGPELAAGLRVMVPLVNRGDGSARSGTSRDSVGALGLTPPHSPPDLAITIVHEFQHSKLSALLDLVPLYAPGGSETHFAPWRADPRPTGGLIQGVYAFLGVADVWRGLRAAPGLAGLATEQFAFVREQVRTGMAALEGSRELTAAGVGFVAGMRASLERLNADAVPHRALDLARSALEERRSAWRERLRGSNVGN